MTKIPYTPLCHDAERTMEDQIRLLGTCAKSALDVWHVYDPKNQQSGRGGGGTPSFCGTGGGGGAGGGTAPSPEERLRYAMQALWNQLSETDIFMAGVHAAEYHGPTG